MNKGMVLPLISNSIPLVCNGDLGYGATIFMWLQLERPLVMMPSRKIQSMSHEIIKVEFTLTSMLVDTLFQRLVFINKIHSQSQDSISHQAFETPDDSMSSETLANDIVLW